MSELDTKETALISARLEAQRRAKMTPEQVADEIAGVLQVLHPAKAPTAQGSREYAEAWVNAGGLMCLHGLMIVDALRSSAKHPEVTDAMAMRAAKKIHAIAGSKQGNDWDKLPRDSQVYFVQLAGAALESALSENRE